MQFSGYVEMKVSHEKLATPPLEERTRTFLTPLNNCGQTKACLGTLHRVCLIKQSSLLPRQKKKKRLRVLQILFTLVSCHMSFQYPIICAVLISQTQVLSTLLLHMEYTWLTPQAGKMSLSCPLGSTCFVLQEKTLF